MSSSAPSSASAAKPAAMPAPASEEYGVNDNSPLPMLAEQTTVTTSRRRRLTAVMPSNTLRQALSLMVALLIVGLVAVAVYRVRQLPNAPIVVAPTGLSAMQYHQLADALGSQADSNVLQADLPKYLAQAQALDWVAQADIRRDWQQGLQVSAVPRQAVAKFGSEHLVDATGAVFAPADSSTLNQSHWVRLQGEREYAAAMLQQAKQVTDWYAPLGLKLQEIIVTPRLSWLLRFDNGLRVLVDNERTTEKLYQLSILLQNQMQPQLAKLQTVDLRYKNGMAVTWRQPEHAPDDSLTTQSAANASHTHAPSNAHQSVKP